MKKKVIIWILVGIIVLAAAGVGAWLWLSNREPSEPEAIKDPDVVEVEKLEQSGEVDTAIEKYKEIILAEPQNVDASIALISAYDKKGDIESARAEAERIMNLVPTDTRIYDTMLDAYVKENRYTDAVLYVEKIIDPTVKASYEKKLRSEGFGAYAGVGNTAGNLANDGLVAVTDDAIYYSEKMDGKALYRADLNGENKVKLSDLPVRDISVVGDTVYFVDTDQYRINTVKTDGSDHKVLIDAFAQNLTLFGDRVYYSNWGDSCKLYSAKIDGTDNKLVADIGAMDMTISGAWVYYTDSASAEGLYKVRIDGENKVQMTDTNVMFLNAIGQDIYFANWNDEGRLYKWDGSMMTEQTPLSETKVGYINAYGDWVYYIDWLNGERIYRRNLTNDKVEEVTQDAAENVFVVGEYVYFYNTSDGRRLYRVDLDGKHKTLIGK